MLVADGDEDGITVEVVLKNGRILTMRSSDGADMSWDAAIAAKFERLASLRLRAATRSVLDVGGNLVT
ncbi:hypothetical protein LMTR3_21430 [Bradyrhizobium sp. LMTR 3]|nr:hypothetical protein LMTR3_21430 [Bradyrhizobium sp. LMTR 3]